MAQIIKAVSVTEVYNFISHWCSKKTKQ